MALMKKWITKVTLLQESAHGHNGLPASLCSEPQQAADGGANLPMLQRLSRLWS